MGIDFEFSDQFKCNNIYEKYSATEYTFIPKNCKEFFWSVTTTLNAKYLFKSTSVASSFFIDKTIYLALTIFFENVAIDIFYLYQIH